VVENDVYIHPDRLLPDAIDHLADLRVRGRRVILNAIEKHLTNEPTTVTRRRKPLRPCPLASWELRVDHYRVYYQVAVEQLSQIVTVVAVGEKVRDRVKIGGVEVKL
jgi:mRNA-degrading endonuclease RelE of RelBE toxin-antitoxin system